MAKTRTTHPVDEFMEKRASASGTGVTVEIIKGFGMAHVFSGNGKVAGIQRALGIKSTPGKAVTTREMTAVPLSPGQWFVVSAKPDLKGDFHEGLVSRIKSIGFVSEQSSARVCFRLSGSRVQEMMQKGCRLDLASSATGAQWCAQTQIAQCGVILHQINDHPVYDLYVYSGFARHFAEWLEHTGKQLGIGFKI